MGLTADWLVDIVAFPHGRGRTAPLLRSFITMMNATSHSRSRGRSKPSLFLPAVFLLALAVYALAARAADDDEVEAPPDSADIALDATISRPPDGVIEVLPEVPVPFKQGESLKFSVQYGVIHAGTAWLEVPEEKKVKGRPTLIAAGARRIEQVLQRVLQGAQSDRVDLGSRGAVQPALHRESARGRPQGAQRNQLRLRHPPGALRQRPDLPDPAAGPGRPVVVLLHALPGAAGRRQHRLRLSCQPEDQAARGPSARARADQDSGRDVRLRGPRADSQGRWHLQENGATRDLDHRRRTTHAGAHEEQGRRSARSA